MVRIAQHGTGGQLVDLRELLVEVRRICPVEEWRISVQECLGEASAEVERLCESGPAVLAVEQLESLYERVYQTIDGEFVGLAGGNELCRLVAVDSSYWEVSGPPELETAMQVYRSYGKEGD